ncbi:MAG: MT-A70 family methyltransferase [Alphaproteobacteria bacterium]|nr:MT-A70 family methyltransferase [Alphaproteobacteria bacterium]
MRVADVIVRERHRKDMGDVAALARSIEDVGLLQPIVVTPDDVLIAGQRRLEAFKLLGRDDVSATVVPLEDIVRGEFAENMARKAFTPSEEVAIWRSLAPNVSTPVGRPKKENGGNLPPLEKGKTRDKVASYLGKSGKTLEKQVALVEAAEAEPEKYAQFVADMDRTGRVSGPYKRLVVARKAESIRREAPPLPGRGPYRVIVADPPWPYEVRLADPSHRGTTPYPQMSIEQICSLDVGRIAHDDCLLWLWTTNHHMREAFTVLDAWGFEQRTILTWFKDQMGIGKWLRGQTEHVLMAARGRPIVELTNQTTALPAPRRAHSQKPDEFYEFVERLCPATRYAELFQRTSRLNWDGHGDEVAP